MEYNNNQDAPVNVTFNLSTATLPCKAARWASRDIALKFRWAIASLSNIASDKTTDDAPSAIYSPIKSVCIPQKYLLINSPNRKYKHREHVNEKL